MNVSLVVKAPKDDKVVSRYEKKQSSYIYIRRPFRLGDQYLPRNGFHYRSVCIFWTATFGFCGKGTVVGRVMRVLIITLQNDFIVF